MIKEYVVLVFMMLTSIINAQNEREENFKEKSIKYQASYYYEMANNAKNARELDSIFYYGLKSIRLAEKCECDTIFIKSNYIIGTAYRLVYKDKDKAFFYLNRSDSLATKLNYLEYMHYVNVELGWLNHDILDFSITMKYFKKSLDFAIEMNDSIKMGRSYSNIGYCYREMGQYKLAKIFYSQGIGFKENISMKQHGIDLFWGKVFDYMNLVMIEIKLLNKKEALFYFKTIDVLLEENNSVNFRESTPYVSLLGNFYFDFEEYEKVINYYESFLKKSLSKKDTTDILERSLLLARASIKINKIKNAKIYFDKFNKFKGPKSIFYKGPNTTEIQKEYYQTAIDIYTLLGEKDKIIENFMQLSVTQDSISKMKIGKIYAEYGVKFDTEQKDKELAIQKLKINEEINRNNVLIYKGVLGGLLLLFSFFSFYFILKRKKEKAELSLEKEKEFTKFRTHFLENISHEIRTPITLIIGYINLIIQHVENPKKIKEYANSALSNSNNVIKDANEILTLLKLEKNELRLNKVDQSLNIFINDLFFSFKDIAQQGQNKLVYKTNLSDDIMVQLDYEKLEKILNNLISNALKYGKKNSEIILNVNLSSGNLIIKIKDQGIGIARSELSKIFSRFYQTKNNKSVGGMGIGLSLVKELVTFLNGTILVESVLGDGSTFTVNLPVDKHNLINFNKLDVIEFLPEEFENSKNNKVNKVHPNILVVEDDKEMSNYLSEILTPHFNCDFAYNGEEGLFKVKQKKYDLILSDLMMPIIDGIEFKEELNKIKGYESIPFVLLSANTLTKNKIKGFTIGVNDYLVKPFIEGELLARIKNLLVNHSIKVESDKIFDESDISIDYNNSFNSKFLEKVTEIINRNIDNDDFKVSDLAKECNYSQRQLSRMLIKITGMSPVRFILEIRLLKSYELIINKTYPNLNDVMNSVSINSNPYFNKKFSERFGIKPRELLVS